MPTFTLIARGSALNLFERNSAIEENWSPQEFLKKVDFPKISHFHSSKNRRYFLIILFSLFFWEKWCMISWPWPIFSRSNRPFSKTSLNLNISQMVCHTGKKFYRVSPRSRVIRRRKQIPLCSQGLSPGRKMLNCGVGRLSRDLVSRLMSG